MKTKKTWRQIWNELGCVIKGHNGIPKTSIEKASLQEPNKPARDVSMVVIRSTCQHCGKLLDVFTGGVVEDPETT